MPQNPARRWPFLPKLGRGDNACLPPFPDSNPPQRLQFPERGGVAGRNVRIVRVGADVLSVAPRAGALASVRPVQGRPPTSNTSVGSQAARYQFLSRCQMCYADFGKIGVLDHVLRPTFHSETVDSNIYGRCSLQRGANFLVRALQFQCSRDYAAHVFDMKSQFFARASLRQLAGTSGNCSRWTDFASG